MLSFLLWFPILGSIFVGFIPGKLDSFRLRQITTIFAFIIFGATIWLLTQFNLSDSGFQFSEYLPWSDFIGLSYSLAVDGLSLPLIALNSLLTIIAIYSIGENVERPRLYYALTLLINAGITGALAAQNLLLFVIFYELELIPFYLMIAIWGGEKKGYASTKFLLYTAVSGLLVLAAFLGIGLLNGASSFDYDIITTEGLELNTKLILLTILLIGFGIKIPLVPLHTWLPDAYTEASPAVTVLLGGILAKLGTYGLIRFGLQLFPDAWAIVSPGLAIIGTVSVLYGALSAIAQKDIKRMVAYSSIGHMGYILVAAAAGTQLSILGAVAQMVSHGLILALLFHLVGIVERKVGTRDLDVLNGLMNPVRGLPLTSALLITAGMASAGIPGLVGFIGEFIVFQGSFATFPIPTILCIIASGLTAVYFVILLNRTCFGKLDNKQAYYPKVLPSETIPALVLTLIIIVLGVQPNWLLKWIEPTTDLLAVNVNKIEQVAVNSEQ
ncbi:NADH-quinone oxidoreductase subunit M [Crocosphaera sp.]|uniref:NADH-quinone oxidoreductase subunit M n=1 Tax=Crocosphaera sp. TaxID=2729996 RepID=UPI0026135F30|nr:NADH-quinone oxidoreductase subunit M [Crocosphaera sp.]MDJ0580213.1 NADH-quinone oxidoreductase subunit M [Crocosphaera sp.]